MTPSSDCQTFVLHLKFRLTTQNWMSSQNNKFSVKDFHMHAVKLYLFSVFAIKSEKVTL